VWMMCVPHPILLQCYREMRLYRREGVQGEVLLGMLTIPWYNNASDMKRKFSNNFLVCRNSEIYNHKQLEQEHLPGVDMHTSSDSALLGYWYEQQGKVTNEMIDSLDGIFAFTLYDERTGHFVAGRDPMGICPMYWGKGADGSTWFASEMKALHDICESFEIFPPVCSLLPQA
jgi:asparagine synthetase B (glutamine-hydrolysing)